jgi:integrase
VSVRKRTWKNRDGSRSDAWVVGHTDQHGKRRLKTFALKHDADTYNAITVLNARRLTTAEDLESDLVIRALARAIARARARINSLPLRAVADGSC